MFTGLIAELGSVDRRSSATSDGATLRDPQPGSPASSREGDSIAVNGVCLTATEVGDDGFQRAGDDRDARALLAARRCAPARPSTSSSPLRAGDRLGGHVVQGHVDGTGTVRAVRERGLRAGARDRRRARGSRAIWSRRARSRVDGVSLTVSALDDDGFSVSLIPETLAAHQPRRDPRGRARQHRGGHPRQARRATDGGYAHEHRRRHSHAVRHDRAGDRGHPRGQDGRRLRRRGPRERGRPDARRPVRDARGDQLHGQGGARPDLPVADRRALRRARARPDGRQERVAVRNPLHGLGRGARRRHHRHLRPRPRAHDPGRDRPREPARATSSSPATCSRSRAAPAACSSAPARPRRRSTSRASPA